MAWLPFHSEKPAIDDAILLEIGRVIVHWAWFENSLAQDIDSLLREASRSGIDHKLRDGVPPTFEKRLKAWHQLCAKFYANMPDRADSAKELYSVALEVSKKRNALVHGFLHGWEPSPDGSVTVTNLRMAGHKRGITQYKFTLAGTEDDGSDV
jgi:hypothetical protein